jgi:hypothetical protein
MTPSMKHHRTTRKKSHVHGLAPSRDTFDRPNWKPVDRAIRKAAWSRLRSERANQSSRIHSIGLVGALLVIVIGFAAFFGAGSGSVFDDVQTRQRAEFVEAEAMKALATDSAAAAKVDISKG